MSITAAHRSVLRQETIVSVAINALIPPAVIWLLDKTPPRTLLWGSGPIIVDLLAAAGLATFLMTLALTSIIRSRTRKGTLSILDWPASRRGLLRWIPQPLVARAVVLAALAILLLVPPALLIVRGLDLLPFGKTEFLSFNIMFGAAVGFVMAPFVLLPAMADQPPRTVPAAA